MKKAMNILATLALATATAFAGGELNTKTSEVKWLGEKLTGYHNGTLGIQSAQMEWEGEALKSLEVVFDMNAIVCTDIEDQETNAMLVGHLKSKDFFNSAEFQTASFKSTVITEKTNAAGEKVFGVQGVLTIKGIAHPIAFDVAAKPGKKLLTLEGTAKFDRTKWNIRYGSGSFFDNLGDKVIYDDIKIDFRLSFNV